MKKFSTVWAACMLVVGFAAIISFLSLAVVAVTGLPDWCNYTLAVQSDGLQWTSMQKMDTLSQEAKIAVSVLEAGPKTLFALSRGHLYLASTFMIALTTTILLVAIGIGRNAFLVHLQALQHAS